jgi:hypothetical protein
LQCGQPDGFERRAQLIRIVFPGPTQDERRGDHGPYLQRTDGDGIPDSWMMKYFGHPTGLASDNSRAQDSASGDGISNLQKYLTGMNPLIWDNLHFAGCASTPDGQFNLAIFGQTGTNYTLLASTDLLNWIPVLNFTCTNTPINVVDPGAKYYGWRFYRIAQGTLPVTLKLALNSPVNPATNGLGSMSRHPLGSAT